MLTEVLSLKYFASALYGWHLGKTDSWQINGTTLLPPYFLYLLLPCWVSEGHDFLLPEVFVMAPFVVAPPCILD